MFGLGGPAVLGIFCTPEMTIRAATCTCLGTGPETTKTSGAPKGIITEVPKMTNFLQSAPPATPGAMKKAPTPRSSHIHCEQD